MECNKNVVKSPYPDISPILNKELHEFIFERSQLYGDMTAFTLDTTGESMTFRQFIHKSKGFGAALMNAGYGKGDIAAILLPNGLEFPIAAFGCWAAGLTIACMNPRYTEDETLRQFQVAKAKLVITDLESLPIVSKAKEANPSIQSILITSSTEGSYDFFHDMVKTKYDGVKFASAKERDPSETIAWLPFSSGTTGPPKLAILTHAQIITNLQQLNQEDVTAVSCYLDTNQQERLFAVMPFFHAYGLCYILIMGLLQGAHTVILPRYRPDTFLKVIRYHKPTVLHLVTPLVSHIVNTDDYSRMELESVHTVFAGGAPIGTALINKLIEKAGRFVFFMEAYGMTEVLGTHVLNLSSKNTRVGSCGRTIPSAMAKVIDVETGVDMPSVLSFKGQSFLLDPKLGKERTSFFFG